MIQTTLENMAKTVGVAMTKLLLDSMAEGSAPYEIAIAVYNEDGEAENKWMTLWDGSITISEDFKSAHVDGSMGPGGSSSNIAVRVLKADWSQVRITQFNLD